MKTRNKDEQTARLPEPITLTPDQLKEVAGATASTVTPVAGANGPIKAGGIRVET
ncbi:MAG: hypothetical protein JOY71_18095 [Acetobacteraceae bacterium]|nr:hypothetical protein [Acetobacteraceae bacterium]MBV8524006.1 hypothetical protein [Acetobacteraceae bacterium]